MSGAPAERSTRSAHGYGYGFQRASGDPRPLVAVEVDGVLALDAGPAVPTRREVVSAHQKWTRTIEVPRSAAATLARLAEEVELVWAGSWSYLAHEALAPVLGLGEEPWPFLAAQFDVAGVVRAYAAGRPWALITEERIPPDDRVDGLVVTVDPSRGIADVDPDDVLVRLGARAP